MAIVGIVAGWLFTVIFGLLTISMLLLKNWPHAGLLFLVVLLCLPPVSTWINDQFALTIHPLIRLALIAGLLFGFVRLITGVTPTSIYATPEVEAQFMQLYEEKMAGWPVPYEDIYLKTQYGTIHVIASGPQEAPPMLLLHASGVSSWSWKFNAAELSKYYRIYAIDTLGDVGQSQYDDLTNIMKNGEEQAHLYADVANQLGIEKSVVVGASDGGAIASHYAIHYPEKVEKLVLMGPMGFAGASQSIIRITLAQFFPLPFVQKATFKWAFSESEILINEFSEWFTLTLTGYTGGAIRVAPSELTAEQRQSIRVPVLFLFGTRDNLVGDPQAATALVQDIPDMKVEIVEAGHLMGGEMAVECNQLILDFVGRS